MASLRARVEDLVRNDAAKNSLLQEMLVSIEQLTQQCDAAKGDLEMARDTAKTYYSKMIQAESQSSRMKSSTEDCDRFVLVLIDGDSMPFIDAFVSRGLEGGEEAAKHLRAAILDYYKKHSRYHADDKIILRVYANSYGLGRTLKAAKFIPDETVFGHFMVGFNNSHPLSEFINAGNRKEAADSKIKANLELFHRNRHCQHIVFGGSADSGYAGFLSPFANPNSISDRITLLEGPPFPADLKRVAEGFPQLRLPAIFRTVKLQVLSNGALPVVTGMKRPASEALATLRGGADLRAELGTTDAVAQLMQSSIPTTPPAAILPPAVATTIYQNQYGQRLDPPLNYDRTYLQHLYDHNAKLCNNFYLKGYCGYGPNCEWDHSQLLSHVQLDTLRHKARTSACRNAFCTDPTCPLGHMCPRQGTCTISHCKFLPEMHSIDTSQVFEVNPATHTRKKVSVDS